MDGAREADEPSTGRLSVLLLNWRDRTNPEGGGSERYVEEIAGRLVRRGHTVTLFCADHGMAPRDEVRDGVRVVRRGTKLTVYPRAMGYVARFGGRYDVVVDVQNGVPFFSPLVRRRPVVVLVHHVHREQWPVVYPRPVARLGWWLESSLAPRVYARAPYVTVSASTRAELHALGVDERRTVVVHNGTDAPTPTPTMRRRPGPRLVVLSRLVPHKQVDHALRVVAALGSRYADLHLDVIGDGWWRPRLEHEADLLGVGSRVTFHGHVTEADKTRLLSQSDILLLPSLKEGWGLVVIEAAHAGVPAIAYRSAGGVSESIIDGHTGLLVDDHHGMVRAVESLLENPQRRDLLGTAARDRAATFSWEATAEAFEKVLQEEVALNRARPVGQELVP
jgi:glycosyltransferase involved in cell wall biosynthesis